jgi:hypothetical protein
VTFRTARSRVTGDKTLRLLTVHIVDNGKPLYIPAKPWRLIVGIKSGAPSEAGAPSTDRKRLERQGCQNVRRLITTARRKLHQTPV